ncbi:MAG: hypothetical protein K1W22_11830 [Lachnospiraceae bacterium]
MARENPKDPTDPEDPKDPTVPEKPADPPTPEKPGNMGLTQTNTTKPDKNTSTSPNTGDHNPIVLCLVMILMSLIAMEVCVTYKRRRHIRK